MDLQKSCVDIGLPFSLHLVSEHWGNIVGQDLRGALSGRSSTGDVLPGKALVGVLVLGKA